MDKERRKIIGRDEGRLEANRLPREHHLLVGGGGKGSSFMALPNLRERKYGRGEAMGRNLPDLGSNLYSKNNNRRSEPDETNRELLLDGKNSSAAETYGIRRLQVNLLLRENQLGSGGKRDLGAAHCRE